MFSKCTSISSILSKYTSKYTRAPSLSAPECRFQVQVSAVSKFTGSLSPYAPQRSHVIKSGAFPYSVTGYAKTASVRSITKYEPYSICAVKMLERNRLDSLIFDESGIN